MDQHVTAGHNMWKKGAFTVRDTKDMIAASGAWSTDDTYTFKIVRYRTPFATTYKLRFAGDQLFVTTEQNVGPAESRITELQGKLM